MAAKLNCIATVLVLLICVNLGEAKRPTLIDRGTFVFNRVAPFTVEQVLELKYPKGEVGVGSNWSAGDTVEIPETNWDADDDEYYFLMMLDLGTSNWPPLQHWLVVNVPGNDLSKGETIYDYLPGGPIKATGQHRYATYIYKQKEKLEKEDYESLIDGRHGNIEHRINTSSDKIKKLLKEDGLIAANFILCDNDKTVAQNIVNIANKYA